MKYLQKNVKLALMLRANELTVKKWNFNAAHDVKNYLKYNTGGTFP